MIASPYFFVLAVDFFVRRRGRCSRFNDGRKMWELWWRPCEERKGKQSPKIQVQDLWEAMVVELSLPSLQSLNRPLDHQP